MEAGDLDGRQDTAHNQRSGDEILLEIHGQVDTALTSQDNRRRHDSGQHCQSMLETEQKRQDDRHGVIETKERACATILLEEGNVGSKEERIIVTADKSLFSEEGLSNTICLVGDSLLWVRVWPDSVCFTHLDTG